MKYFIISLIVLTQFSLTENHGRNIKPQPNALVSETRIKELTGNWEGSKLDRDIKILWLTGPEDHKGGEHDYIRIKELFVPMLKTIPRITVDVAFKFPSQDQFDKADLIIQYLHLPDLDDEQFKMYQNYVDNGGRVVSIHESCIMRPIDKAQKLAKCIGCSWKGNDKSNWSKFAEKHELFINTQHEAFKGLPSSIKLTDESYWNLLRADNVEVIGVIKPADKKVDQFGEILNSTDVRGDAFWTYKSGKGKVFGTTTGHYTYTFYDPVYRLILLRGMAWALDVDPAPFMPLVFHGITDKDGMVGTNDKMMKYKNRKALE